MAKRPEDRFPTYADFRMALEAARSHWLVQSLKQQQAVAKKETRRWWKP
jgi:hypothetical protein